MSLFGTSGIRRLADRELVDLALKMGMAVGRVYSSVVVGSDTRTSGDAIKHAFAGGVLAAGGRCLDAGTAPTPTIALAARGFAAAAVITASHNPPEYNGIKLFNPDGSGFDEKQQGEIEKVVLNGNIPIASWDAMKSRELLGNAVEQHTAHIRRYFPARLGLKAVLDCDCGAASVISRDLLEKMGCEVIPLNCKPSGFFPHPIEPVEANLSGLIKATRENKAALGIAHDGDADRMMAVDDRGRFIPGDKLLVLFAQELQAKEVVTTVDTSMSIEDMGFHVTRTKVGDSFVSDVLRQGGDFGGEPSGAWIFPASSFCPDGIFAAAQIAVMAGKCSLAERVDKIPSYPLLRGGVEGRAAITRLEDRLSALKPVSIDRVDGLKLIFADGWVLVRPSGTEPKMRVTVESRSEARARELFEGALTILRECVREGREG